MGQKRKCPGSRGTSVLPSGADVVSLPRHVRVVPGRDMRGDAPQILLGKLVGSFGPKFFIGITLSGRVYADEAKALSSSRLVMRVRVVPFVSASVHSALSSGIHVCSTSHMVRNRASIGGIVEIPTGVCSSFPLAQAICRSAASQKCLQSGISIRMISVALERRSGMDACCVC
jgi:hypothetical protein